MPSSPGGMCRYGSCTARATDNGYCGKHQSTKQEQKRAYDRYRADDPIRELYRCVRWKRVRLEVLQRDILCRSCGHKAATEVDHILLARLVVDNFGLDEFYNLERLQGLCHDCHSQKTRQETYKVATTIAQDELHNRSNTTVVCGLPGSGKSTYVETRKQSNDVVWDYDVVMSDLTGLPLYQSMPDAIGSVLAKRDDFLRSTNHCPHHVWLIVSNPKSKIVEMLRLAGANVVTVAVDESERQQRLANRHI